jgi:chromosome segregation ATPase
MIRVKNIFHKIHLCYRKLKEARCQLVIAQAELRETKTQLDTAKYKLEKTENMLHERQEEFAEISYKILESEEAFTNIRKEYRKEAKKLDDIILRYKVMYSDYAQINADLDKFKRRTLGIGKREVKLDIPYTNVMDWMERTTVRNPETGNPITIAKFCFDALRKEKAADIKEEITVWGEVQSEVMKRERQIVAAAPEVI